MEVKKSTTQPIKSDRLHWLIFIIQSVLKIKPYIVKTLQLIAIALIAFGRWAIHKIFILISKI